MFPLKNGSFPSSILSLFVTRMFAMVVKRQFPKFRPVLKKNVFLARKLSILQYISQFCQAQPQPQLQLSWAELALTSNSTPTTHPATQPPDHPQKK